MPNTTWNTTEIDLLCAINLKPNWTKFLLLTEVDMDLVDVGRISFFPLFVTLVDNIRGLFEPLLIKVDLYYDSIYSFQCV